jgi:NAD-dependent DNA ligase
MDLVKKILKNSYEAIDNLSIDDLEKLIIFANDKYRNTDTPVMTDELYDICVDFLKLKNPKSKVLKVIGGKVKSKEKVKLDYWLGSMDKIKPSDTRLLEKWINEYKGPYYVSNKLDGISAMIIYRENGDTNLYTRGTADEGLDISPLLKYIKNIPSWSLVNKYKTKSKKAGILLACRGELLMNKDIFKNNWSEILKNGRNGVSGLVNSKTINPKLASDTDFVLYEVIDPFLKFSDQMKILKDLKFNIVKYEEVPKINFEILSNLLLKRKKESEYEIDGLIITNNEENKRNIKSNPEYAFAFKDILDDQKAETKVISIEWNISKDGYIKPTLIVEPVTIGGVEISRTTGNNAKFVVENKLGKGAHIELIRSGDVIPKVNKVLKQSKNVEMPEGEWHWNETNVDIICDSLDNKYVLIKNIYYFFSSLDTKGLGEKIVEKFVNKGYDSILKIIKLTVPQILLVEGFKEKSAQNIIDSIKKSLTEVSLSKIMSASNKLGHGIGEERIKLVLDKFPNLLDDADKWSKDEFINNLKLINGWEEKTSSLFFSNYKEFKKFYNSIEPYITIKKEKVKEVIKNKYTDKTVVMSGFRDSELQQILEDSGAKITNSVSKNTDYLIVKDQNTIDENTGKVQKAHELGIKIISIDSI